jgi:hypothetical protein
MTGVTGIATAIELALQDGAGAEAGDLVAVRPADGKLPLDDGPEHGGEGGSPLDPMVTLGADLFGQPRRGRAGGRPKGSRNKVTETFREYFLTQHRHPALQLAEFAAMPVEELARRLQCKLFDAAKLQAQCLTAILPYVERRQPIAVELPAGSGLTLVIGALGAPGSPQAAPEQYQWVAGTYGVELVEGELVDPAKAVADQGLAPSVPLMVHPPGGEPGPAPDPAAVSIMRPTTGPDTAPPGGVPKARDVPPHGASGRDNPADQKFLNASDGFSPSDPSDLSGGR